MIEQADVYFFRSLVEAVDSQQLGLDLLTEDPRRSIATEARHRTAAKCAVDVDGPAGDNLCTLSNRAQHGHVAFAKNRLPGTHGAIEQQRSCLRLGFRLFRLGLRQHAVTPTRQ